jgi:hypothetical protein
MRRSILAGAVLITAAALAPGAAVAHPARAAATATFDCTYWCDPSRLSDGTIICWTCFQIGGDKLWCEASCSQCTAWNCQEHDFFGADGVPSLIGKLCDLVNPTNQRASLRWMGSPTSSALSAATEVQSARGSATVWLDRPR